METRTKNVGSESAQATAPQESGLAPRQATLTAGGAMMNGGDDRLHLTYAGRSARRSGGRSNWGNDRVLIMVN